MIIIKADYFDGNTSKANRVTIYCEKGLLKIKGDESNQIDLDFTLSDCTINPPLGRTSRSLILPNGGKCVTDDFKNFKMLESQSSDNKGLRIVHILETRRSLVLSCFILLIISVYLFANHGIPMLAKIVSHNLPITIMDEISQKSLNVLDSRLFTPSELEEVKKAEIISEFQNLVNEISSEFNYKLEFRDSNSVGAIAFALPSGIIIITDELVALSKNNREIVGILLHEIGHVENRHGLRSVLQNTGVFFLISALVGDVVSITSIAGTIPTILVENGYSRKFESEADEFSGVFMINKGWGTSDFCNILKRITKDHGESSMLSTHPGTDERVEKLLGM